jgi:hypothetical protein
MDGIADVGVSFMNSLSLSLLGKRASLNIQWLRVALIGGFAEIFNF